MLDIYEMETQTAITDSDTPKQQQAILDDKLASTDRPTLPFAADATHDPEDPLRRPHFADSEKFASESDSDTRLGDVADVQNASKRPQGDDTASPKKLTTSQAVST